MRRNKVLRALLVLAVVAAGCAEEEPPTDTAGEETPDAVETTPAGPASYSVQIDGQADGYNSSFFAYFPDEVTVHPGDSVVYESVFTGEPHSIAFGTSVADVVDAFQALPPEALEQEGPPPAELEEAIAKIPPMLPEGPGDAIQTSVNPCFVAEGEEIPEATDEPCPVTEAEPFTGTETFYNSGFLPDGERFEMQLAEDIEPGTYVGICTLHYTEMMSTINVVPEDEEIPSPDEVEEDGQEQLSALGSALEPAVEGAPDEVGDSEVLAGVVDEDVRGALANEFVPGDVEVGAGEAITWNIQGPHTVSFNASEDLRVLLARGDDGWFHLNADSVMPAGFDAPPPPEGEPEGPPPPLDAGTWDGTGFLSSGILFGGPFTVAISEPGTYEYVCLIHPDMDGRVTVN